MRNYLTVEELENVLEDIAKEFPDVVTPVQVGETFHGNPIRGYLFANGEELIEAKASGDERQV